jgi:hypothetical protein
LERHREGGIGVRVGGFFVGIATDLLGVALGGLRRRRGLVFHVAEGFLALLAILRFGVGRILGIVFLVFGILLVLLLLRRIGFVGGLALIVFFLLLIFIGRSVL